MFIKKIKTETDLFLFKIGRLNMTCVFITSTVCFVYVFSENVVYLGRKYCIY